MTKPQIVTDKLAKINTLLFIKEYEKIRDKESNIVPFVPNKGQMRLYNAIKTQKLARKPVRIVVLKARQIGFSTMTGGVFYKDTITHPNKKTVIVAHEDAATNNLFEMYKRFNKNMPSEFRHDEKANNAKAIIWDNKEGTGLDSSITCKTASDDGIGASQTINNLHLSEYGLWKGSNVKMTFSSIMQCVPNNARSMVIVESTARGFNHFYDLCELARQGKGGWMFIFVAWWENEEYRLPYTGFSLTLYEEEIKEKYNLDNDQLEWRRWCIDTNCSGDVNIFNQEYPACPEDAFISSGDCYFPKLAIANRRYELQPPLRRFEFEYKSNDNELALRNVTQRTHDNGYITIYKEPVPRHPYVIGADTSGEGSDYFVAQVIDNISKEQVAMLRFELGERKFVEQIYCLGMYYNKALIAVETNFSTYPSEILTRMDYPKMYIRKSTDNYENRLLKAYGFRTTTRTRPVALGAFRDLVKDEMTLINDSTTLSEMMTFVKDESTGRPAAMKGMHDDTVMALAIAYYCSDQQETSLLVEEEEDEYRPFEWPEELRPSNGENEEGEYIVWTN